jgi:hypothetical protein
MTIKMAHNARPLNDRKADAFIAGAVKQVPVQDESTGKAW